MITIKQKSISFLVILALVFSIFTVNTTAVDAASKKITLKASASGQSQAVLTWNKISKPYNGYAVFRDGKPIKYLGKKTTKFTDRGLASGSLHKYQIKSYKKIKKYYNSKKKKWVTKKPKASQWKGKKTKYTYSYKTKSKIVSIRTAYAYFTITFNNWNGDTLQTLKVKKGDLPKYTGPAPTKDEDNDYSYKFKGWDPAIVAANTNTTYTAQFKATSKPENTNYTYDMHFINEPYGNGGETIIYLKTTNPNYYDWEIYLENESGKSCKLNQYERIHTKSNNYIDLDLTPYNTGNVKNYIIRVLPEYVGNCTFTIYESKYDSNGDFNHEDIVYTKEAYIKDYYAEENKWINQVINEVTDSSMSNDQKMKEICNYILDNFNYTKVPIGASAGGECDYIELIADKGIPYWIEKRLNSYTSPALLVKFGEKLGYPLHNCYNDYTEGTSEWSTWHMYTYYTDPDTSEKLYYEACPVYGKGAIDVNSIEMFNPNTFPFWD